MKLSVLLTRLKYKIVQGTEEITMEEAVNIADEIEAGEVTNDTRNMKAGDVFVCVEGAQKDGHLFAQEAAERGASAIVVEKEITAMPGVPVIKVTDSRYALAVMSAAYYGYPAEGMKLIGITGTKGKTTTAWMIWQLMTAAGLKIGLIGTIQIYTGAHVYTNHNTTPESCQIQAYLREMRDAGCTAVVMEVSSQGLKLQRTAGLFFEAGVFTNLGRDHIGPGEHADFEEYKQCKHLLFLACRYGIGNADDIYCQEMFAGTSCRQITYGLGAAADEQAFGISKRSGGGHLGIRYEARGLLDCSVELPMPGTFNIYNSLAAVVVCTLFGVPGRIMEEEFPRMRVPGRMEPVEGLLDASVFVDYAHNAMSLASILKTVREYEAGRLVVVFGCGGNRSRERRFEMGRTAGQYADLTIITTDNPRYEKPEAVIQDIITGIKDTNATYKAIMDRREAVRYAIKNRQPGDIIIIAGKGHETYQEIKGVRYYMDDRSLALEAIIEATEEPEKHTKARSKDIQR